MSKNGRDITWSIKKTSPWLKNRYPTFCFLAGVAGTDDPPEPPAAVDPSQPGKNIYGTKSFPAVDGVNVWPLIVSPPAPANRSAAHQYLVLSKEVILAGDHKLLVAQNFGWPHTADNGWKPASGGQFTKPSETMPCMATDLAGGLNGSLPGVPGQLPCLFDTSADESERHDVAESNAALVTELWAELNHTVLTAFCKVGTEFSKTPGCDSTPPDMLGSCDPACASKYWRGKGGGAGPVCGVPGC